MKAFITAAAALSLVGCASVMNDVTHGVRVDTKTEAGAAMAGADCTASNDYGSTSFKSGTTQALRRSSKDMEIVCTRAGHAPAKGTAKSRANAGLAGNLIVGGVIGAVVDHNRGTAYTYPTWIELVFGRALMFDRSREKEGAALQGVALGSPEALSSEGRSGVNSQQCMQQAPGAIC